MYKIVIDQKELDRFIDFLPYLTPDEKFYVTLFARKKYTTDVRFKSDKNQLKRLVINRQDLSSELRKLEVADGLYKFNDIPIPQEMLAVYINPNPRSMYKSSLELLSRTAKNLRDGLPLGNPKAEAMNCLQSTPSRKLFFDIDIDIVPGEIFEHHELIRWIEDNDIINLNSLEIIQTRGGYHILITHELIDPKYSKKWYGGFNNLINPKKFSVMMNSDNLIPIPGCVQGNSVPRLLRSTLLKY